MSPYLVVAEVVVVVVVAKALFRYKSMGYVMVVVVQRSVIPSLTATTTTL